MPEQKFPDLYFQSYLDVFYHYTTKEGWKAPNAKNNYLIWKSIMFFKSTPLIFLLHFWNIFIMEYVYFAITFDKSDDVAVYFPLKF